jgi:D-glycero-D-manno-heptose 1,7-bisphosphate phosphatase
MAGRRLALLDRDGTIIVERNYLSHPEDVALLPGAAEGLRALRALGLGLVVVTNQSGVGRGYFDEARLGEIHARMNALLAGEEIVLDGIYYCPHTPDMACACRKPQPGLALRAAADQGCDLSMSFAIGDKRCDIDLGRNVGATSILVRTGYGEAEAALPGLQAHHICSDLPEAAAIVSEYTR